MSLQHHNKPFRIFALLVCWCFVSAAQASDCEAPCAGMPCCEQEELSSQDAARGEPCCDVPEPLHASGIEPSKLLFTLPSVQTQWRSAPPRLLRGWSKTPISASVIHVKPIYLTNCVLRC